MSRFYLPGILVIVFVLFTGCIKNISNEDAKPNFVWIISEDNSTHYERLFDEHGIATPHIEALAEDGIIFRNAYSNGAVCSVARSTLISACYAPRIGAQFHRKIKKVPMPDGVEMFPAYLREAGYYTSNRHKEDYNIVKEEGVWDESSPKAHWRKRADGQAFFHKASYGESHESCLHFNRERMHSYKPSVNPDDVFVFPQHPDTELFRYTGAYYRDRIVLIDSIVGDVLAQLEEDGLLESTFVFYFGDHGGVLPGSKAYSNEGGVHVPLVVRVPEKFKYLVKDKQGSSREDFVEFVDFGPSILELAGITIPEGIDGKPFLLDKKEAKNSREKELVYSYADRFDEKYDFVRTVRKGNFKYVRNYQPFIPDGLQNNYRYKCMAFEEWRELFLDDKLNETQSAFFLQKVPEMLFDLECDPYETTNLAKDPSYGDQLLEMRVALDEYVTEMPDLSFFPESVLIKDAFENPTAFGQAQKEQIKILIDIANLELLVFDEAKAELLKALESEDPWERYWGLIVCSSFGAEAEGLKNIATVLLEDEELLVRARAAEYLAILGVEGMDVQFRKILRESNDSIEALLILNTVTMLRDAPYNYTIEIDETLFAENVLKEKFIKWRLEYLCEVDNKL